MKLHLLVATAFVGVALAHDPGAGPGLGMRRAAPSFDSLKTYLSLSDSQLSSLRNLRQQQMEANRATFQEMRTKARALYQQLQAGTTDANAVGTAVLELHALKKKIRDSSASYRTQALALLTDDQKAKLKTLEDAAALHDEVHQATALNLLAKPEMMMGHGPFGMDMPPGPAARPMRRR